MQRKRCRVCREVYNELIEIRRIEGTGFCTACKWSNPLCQPEVLRLWSLNRDELDEVLAERFALPLEIIRELLDCCIEEELFDLISEIEDTGRLAIERQQLWHGAEGPEAPRRRGDPHCLSAFRRGPQ